MNNIVGDIGVSLWRLLPGNPIVIRVVQGGSKRLPHLWTRAAYLGILFFVLLIANWESLDSTGSLSERAKSATQVFKYVSILQLAMMCLLAPVFAAGAISQEKDAETFNVLLTTPLTNAQIVLGSLASRMFFVIALLLSGLPIFCITMLYGGVTTHQIFLSFGIAGCTAIIMGSVAITVSVMRIGTRSTIFGFYMGVAIFLLAGFALGMWPRMYVPESLVPGSSDGMSWLTAFHPFLSLLVAMNLIRAPEPSSVAHYGWPLAQIAGTPHTVYMIFTLVLSVVLVAFATIFVRRGIKQGEQSLWSRLTARFRTRREGEQRRKARRVWANPVAWREAVTRGTAASSDVVRYSYIGLGAVAAILLLYNYLTGSFMVTSAPPHNEARGWLTAIVLIEFVVVMLMATNAAATAISKERESGTMELLLTTPLTSKYIVWGKLRGLVSFTVPLLAVPALTVLAAAIAELFVKRAPGEPPLAYLESAVLLPPLMLVYSAFACMLGLQMSLKTKRSVQAVLSSVGILIVIGFGLSMCAVAAMTTPELGAILSPVTFVAAIWMVLNPDHLSRRMGYGNSVSLEGIGVLLAVGSVIAIALFGAIVAGTYRSMVTNFDMIVRKQSK